MAIISSIDLRPIFFDSLGNPASFGRIIFYQKGTTTLKTIYADEANTTPLENPLLLSASGRPEQQIFLGVGDYTCVLERFTGSNLAGVDYSEIASIYFAFDNEWDQSGNTIPQQLTGYVYTVDTVDILRTVDPLVHPAVSVLGYYDRFDAYARIYIWTDGATAFDNGGQSILHNGDATGAWILAVTGDVREWGVIPNKNATFNSQLSLCESYLYDATGSEMVMYFPSGKYKVSAGSNTFRVPVRFDVDAKFEVGVFNYTATFTNAVFHESNTPLGTVLNGGNLFFKLSDTQLRQPIVDVGWYNYLNVATLDSALKKCAENIDQGYVIAISKGYNWSLTTAGNTVTVNNDLQFSPSAYINFNNTSGSLSIGTGVRIEMSIGTSKIFRGLIDCIFCYTDLHTKWFSTFGGTTDDLQVVLTDVNGFTTVIYDATTSLFSYAYTAESGVQHIYASGVVKAVETVKIPLSNMGYNSLIGPIVLTTSTSKLSYWGGGVASFPNAVFSMANGSGELDLNGEELSLVAQTTIYPQCQNVIIRNGSFNNGTSTVTPFVFDGGTLDSISFTDVSMSTDDSVAASLCVIKNGCSVNQLSTVRCKYRSLLGQYLLRDGNCPVSDVIIEKSTITAQNLAYGFEGDDEVVGNLFTVRDSRLVLASSNLELNPLLMSGCNIVSTSFPVAATHQTNVSDNFFAEGSTLSMYAHNTMMRGKVKGNTFVSRGSAISLLLLTTRMTDTCFKGLIATNNEFDVTDMTAQTSLELIQVTGSYSSTFEHQLCVKDNRISNLSALQYRVGVPCTEGTKVVILDYDSVGVGSNFKWRLDVLNVSNKPCFLNIPNFSSVIKISALSLITPISEAMSMLGYNYQPISLGLYTIAFDPSTGASTGAYPATITFKLFGL